MTGPMTIYGKGSMANMGAAIPRVGEVWLSPGNFERVKIVKVELYMVYAEGLDKDIEVQGDLDGWVKMGQRLADDPDAGAGPADDGDGEDGE